MNWEESWINTAKKLVKDTFECSYLTMETDDHDDSSDTLKLKNVCSNSRDFPYVHLLIPTLYSGPGQYLQHYGCPGPTQSL